METRRFALTIAESKALFMNHRNDAVALDRDDPLAPLREHFSLHDDTLYFDGNSLGVPPRAAGPRPAS